MKLIYNIFNYLENKCAKLKQYGNKDFYFPENSELDPRHIAVLDALMELSNSFDISLIDFEVNDENIHKWNIKFRSNLNGFVKIVVVEDNKEYYYEVVHSFYKETMKSNYTSTIRIRRTGEALRRMNDIIQNLSDRVDKHILENIKNHPSS